MLAHALMQSTWWASAGIEEEKFLSWAWAEGSLLNVWAPCPRADVFAFGGSRVWEPPGENENNNVFVDFESKTNTNDNACQF